MKKLKIFLLFLTFSSAQIVDRVKIESQLEIARNELVFRQSNLTRRLLDYSNQAKFCSSNLKASNFPKDFTDDVDNLMALINRTRTLDDHPNLSVSVELLSTFDYVQYRALTTNSDQRNFKAIVKRAQGNMTKLFEIGKNVTEKYQKYYRDISKLLSKNKTVMSLIRNLITSVFREFGVYIQWLTAHEKNMKNLNSYFVFLISNKTVTAPANETSSDFMMKVRSIESKLIPAQLQVIINSRIALNKTIAAQQNVASARKVGNSFLIKMALTFMQIDFTNSMGKSDYPIVAWPRLPDTSSTQRSSVRIRSSVCDVKERNFGDTMETGKSERSTIQKNRENFDLLTKGVQSSSNGTRKVQAQSQAALDVITAAIRVEDALLGYTNKLNFAIFEIQNLRSSIFQSMTTTTKLRSSTTTVITTTTRFVLPPCGE